nr:putative reverse transcriptase domain-containing protein [Tanacetum cinerariifolium]
MNARNPTTARGACFECSGIDHFNAACPRLNQMGGHPNQVMVIYEGQGRGNNGNRARGGAFMLGAEEARQDPNIMTGIESSNLGFNYEIEIAKSLTILTQSSFILRIGRRRSDRALYYLDRIWVPLKGDVRTIIMDEAHKSKYSVYPGADKMYYDLRDMYWWPETKKDIAVYDVPILIILDRDCHFTSRFWQTMQEALGTRKCRSPIMWAEVREGKLIGPKLVDHVLLKVSPWKGVVRFGKKRKLIPRFVGPFEITERIEPVAYRLRLPEEVNGVHDTFHMSNLKKCLADPT